eukprot:3948671-Prymnesium_polylepis.4
MGVSAPPWSRWERKHAYTPANLHLVRGGSIVQTDHLLRKRWSTKLAYASADRANASNAGMVSATIIMRTAASSDVRSPKKRYASAGEPSVSLAMSS